MNCANHPELPAAAFCRECGKPICTDCQRPALGSVFCQEHLPVIVPPPPYPAGFASPYTSATPVSVPDPNVHPGLALVLGFIPGVGAIYNGQYAKGLVHAVIFGLLISITSSNHGPLQPLFGIMIGVWVIYQAFEAYHTARQRRYGGAVEEFSSLLEIRPVNGRFPIGAILLIVLGFVLLLDTTDIISFYQVERFWPALLIVLGLYMLYVRLTPADRGHSVNGEVRR